MADPNIAPNPEQAYLDSISSGTMPDARSLATAAPATAEPARLDLVGALRSDLNRLYPSPQKTAERERLQTQADQAAMDTKQTIQQGKINEAEQTQRVIKEYGTAERALVDQYNRKLADTPLPSFVPTPTTATDIASVFSLMGIIGMALGGKGQMSALGAMNSMTGMMTGWKQGRLDLYNQELKNFEKNYQVVQQQRKDMEADLGRARELLKTDLAAAQQEIAVIAAKHGSEVLKKLNAEVGPTRALEAFDRTAKDEKDMAERVFKLREEELKLRAQADRAAGRTVLVEHPTEKGKNAYIDPRTGQYMRDANGNVLVAGAKASGAAAGGLNGRFAYNIAEAFAQAHADIMNVAEAPAGTALGMFAGLAGQSGDSLYSGLRNALGRSMTSDDARIFQQIVSGIEAHMSRALGGGYASSGAKHIVDLYKQQVPQAGDSPVVMAMFLARIKQELGILADKFQEHPGATDLQVRRMQDLVRNMDRAIPFNVKDVQAATRGERGTVSDRAQEIASGGPKGGNLQTSEGLSQEDKDALDWANNNPADPRAAKIKKALGVE